jgi:hypothetical protein
MLSSVEGRNRTTGVVSGASLPMLSGVLSNGPEQLMTPTLGSGPGTIRGGSPRAKSSPAQRTRCRRNRRQRESLLGRGVHRSHRSSGSLASVPDQLAIGGGHHLPPNSGATCTHRGSTTRTRLARPPAKRLARWIGSRPDCYNNAGTRGGVRRLAKAPVRSSSRVSWRSDAQLKRRFHASSWSAPVGFGPPASVLGLGPQKASVRAAAICCGPNRLPRRLRQLIALP